MPLPKFSHVYATIAGRYTQGAYAGEVAQIGLRVGVWPDPTSPDLDGVLPLRDPQQVEAPVDNPNFTGWQGWHGENLNIVPGARYWSLAHQIDLANALRDHVNRMKGMMHTSFVWEQVKIAPISAEGKVACTPTALRLVTPVSGTGGDQLPPQLAIAVTFRTPIPSRRGRGRQFIPALSRTATMDSTGKVGSSARTTIGTSARDLIVAVKGIGGVEIVTEPIITSAGNPRYVLPRQVRVGDQFDSQRQRREGVREVYSQWDL